MGIYRATIKLAFTPGSKGGTNTWHIRSTSIPLPATPTILDAIKTFYTANAGLFPSSMTFTWDGTLAQVDVAEPPVLGGGTPFTVAGTGTSAAYSPAGVGVCVSWKSGTATRSGRGRTFLTPVAAVAMATDGSLTDTNLTTLRNAANALVATSKADGNGALSVWSQTQRIGRDVQSAAVQDRVAWLSSRRGR